MLRNIQNTIYISIIVIGFLVINVQSRQPDTGSGEHLKPLSNKNPYIILSVEKGFPTPGAGDPRGLTWDGSYLWMAEDDTKSLYQIDTLDGSILDTIPTPGISNTQGVTWDGSYIWHAEYNGNVYKIDPQSETIVDTITAPTTRPTGLAWDGTNLWTASYQDDKVYQFSPNDGSLIHSFASVTTNPWGLTWAGTSLWNVQNSGGDIYGLDPEDGSTKNTFSAIPGSNLLGMTSDGMHLWVVDNTKDSLFKFDILAITTDIDIASLNLVVDTYYLDQNYPNPFNPSTKIRFSIPKTEYVELIVYNSLGQELETLINQKVNQGYHEIDFYTDTLPSGVYIYRIKAGNFQDTKKMILLK